MLLEFLTGLGRKPRIIKTVEINRQFVIPLRTTTTQKKKNPSFFFPLKNSKSTVPEELSDEITRGRHSGLVGLHTWYLASFPTVLL